MAPATTAEIDGRVKEIFRAAIDGMGGIAKITEQRQQVLLPALVESAYILVMREEANQSPEQIADFLGVSVGVVQSVFEAPLEALQQRMRHRDDDREEFSRHLDPEWNGEPLTARLEPEYLAGALAKFAYGVVKREHGFHT